MEPARHSCVDGWRGHDGDGRPTPAPPAGRTWSGAPVARSPRSTLAAGLSEKAWQQRVVELGLFLPLRRLTPSRARADGGEVGAGHRVRPDAERAAGAARRPPPGPPRRPPGHAHATHQDARTPPVEVAEEDWRATSDAARASLLQLLFGPLDGAPNVAPMAGVGTPPLTVVAAGSDGGRR